MLYLSKRGVTIMEWRVYVIACGNRQWYYATACKAEALDKLLVLERRHDLRYQFEIEPVTF